MRCRHRALSCLLCLTLMAALARSSSGWTDATTSTTAAQGTILPFHANLFEAAIEAKVPIQAFAIRYVDAKGALHHAVDFTGDMTFAASMNLILRGGKITAELRQLPLISTDAAHRREVAQAARLAIAQSLGMAENL